MRDNAESVVRIGALFDEHAPRLLAHARRLTDHEAAQDLVAGAFEVALRRPDKVPRESGDAFAWLVTTVRKQAANDRRRARTAERHWFEEVRAQWHLPSGVPLDEAVTEREAALEALAALSEAEREALLLVAWDGLPAAQAARVVGCSPNAFGVRLHRARSRLLHAEAIAITPIHTEVEGIR